MANKGVRIFLIVILTIIAIILMNIMVLKIMNKDLKLSIFAFGNKTDKIFENEYDVEGIKKINVGASSSNVKFVEGKQNKIKVTAYGTKDEKISAEINGDTLDIKKDNQVLHIFMFFCWYREEIIVEIPQDFAGDVKTNISSGNIDVMDLENSNLYLEASSGNIRCGDMVNGNIKTSSGNISAGSGKVVNIKASSGSIKAESIESGKAETSSGNIQINKIEEGEVKASSGSIKIGDTNKINARTTSGSIVIESINGFCDIEAKSGGVKIENLNISENSRIETKSGGVRILNTGDIFVDTKTKSGGVSVDNNNRKSNVELKIETTSGGIKVNKK